MIYKIDKPMLSNRVYDYLRLFVELWIPAFATLYFSLATIWNLPNAENVVATSAALATFFGVTLRLSSRSYQKSDAKYDGVINVSSPTPDTTLYSLDLNSNPDSITNKKEMVFKVNPNS